MHPLESPPYEGPEGFSKFLDLALSGFGGLPGVPTGSHTLVLVQTWGTVGGQLGRGAQLCPGPIRRRRPPCHPCPPFPTGLESGPVARICPVLEELFRCGQPERVLKQLKPLRCQSSVRGTETFSAMLMPDMIIPRWSRAGHMA